MGLPRNTRAALVRAPRALGRELAFSVRSWPGLRQLGAGEQADGHRFVWWPSPLAGRESEVIVPYIEEGRRHSRHDEVTLSVWQLASRVLPRSRDLAGTFPFRAAPTASGS